MSATPKPPIEGDSSQNPPPSYDEVVDKTAQEKNSKSTIAVRTQPTLGPIGNRNVYKDTPGINSIELCYWSDNGLLDRPDSWVGEMRIKCSDVPLLMREGSYWTVANVIREAGFVDRCLGSVASVWNKGRPKHPFTIRRTWLLQDLQTPPRWVAYLVVSATKLEILSGVQLEEWASDMAKFAMAWNPERKIIYSYDVRKPRCHFNCIYDQMPLKGWWPWPKEPKQASTTSN